jgi:hypothetical protein
VKVDIIFERLHLIFSTSRSSDHGLLWSGPERASKNYVTSDSDSILSLVNKLCPLQPPSIHLIVPGAQGQELTEFSITPNKNGDAFLNLVGRTNIRQKVKIEGKYVLLKGTTNKKRPVSWNRRRRTLIHRKMCSPQKNIK